jgi:hypothetical protein
MSVEATARAGTQASDDRLPRRFRTDWIDRLLGSDPGLTRLLSALQAVVTIGVAMFAEWIFVHTTHALQIDTHGATLPAAEAAQIAAQHHGVLVVGILIGAIMGMIAAFSAALFTTPIKTIKAFAAMPVLMIAGLSVGLALAPYRLPALASFVVVLALGGYARRFGPLGFVGGMVVFMGDFFGFFLNGELHLKDLGWLTAEIVIGVLVALVAQFTLFYPSRRAALRRMLRSYIVRAREVSACALDLFDGTVDRTRGSRRLHRRLTRLNEAALMIDAQLTDPRSLPDGRSPVSLHQNLFDAELALTNTARFAEQLATFPLPNDMRSTIRTALLAVGERDVLQLRLAGHELLGQLRGLPVEDDRTGLDRTARIVVHRFASSVLGLADAVEAWRGPQRDGPDDAFQPSVTLMAGWLPGSAMVSAAASLEGGPGALDRGLKPNIRVAIQMGVAVTAAIIVGDAISGRRFYWAVLAAFVTFMGANNAAEQLRKGFFRVAGTVVGVLIGAVLAHAVGDRTGLAIAVILIALFFGLYLMRISYGLMVIGVTVMVSQLYVQLDEFSDSLLALRLGETAVGAALTALTVLFVLPLRVRRVARVACRQYLQAVRGVADAAVERLAEAGDASSLRAALRRMDAAYQTLVTTMNTMRIPLPGGVNTDREKFLNTITASRHYARNLLIDSASRVELTPEARSQLRAAGERLGASLDEIVAALLADDAGQRTYVRAASQFDLVATGLDAGAYTAAPQLALRDLQLIDGSMALLAEAVGLNVQALDTAPRR